jgi:hypothetical protein
MEGASEQKDASGLQQGLSQRQLNMIAIGGVIGAGLFVGSGASSWRELRRPRCSLSCSTRPAPLCCRSTW